MGLVGLLRTSASQHRSQPYMGLHDADPKPRYRNDAGDAGLATFADLAKEKVQDWSAQASEAVRQTGTQIADKTASVADRASATLHDAGDAARDTMTQIADKAASVAERTSHRLRDTIPDQDGRDTYLLGAAALAVAAAVGIAYHRRAEEGTRPRGH
jgi:dsDNA-specific endonuclease/ATPase MutS2